MNRRRFLAAGGSAASLAVLAGLPALSACTVTGSGSSGNAAEAAQENARRRREIDADVDAALERLYGTVNGSRELIGKSSAVLVFPDVVGAAIGVGGQYGRGALRAGGRTVGYFSTTAGSFGFQIGAQSRAVYYAFMTQGAFERFKRSSGWKVGADATVALVKMGVNGQVDTSTAVNPIEAFVLTNAGLMAGASLEGSKVSRLDL
ncbi:BPSL1445 family SYLF domain-containing lipoprotein [Paraburkholderia oxyphila]|uniref:BPSL1445 family SYLF domain-containing lipoprotein n=1 Tax=Paraburkholderia oxyphila TaxID=614212 RepID=UPI000484AF62|nr:YSC84-related protein [Paraburkholderia oxyphila]